MGVRSARLDEIGKFYELWEEFLDEHNPAAGVLVDNTRALNEAGRLFQAYVGGSKNGSCHFWVDGDDVPQGVFLTGEPLGYFDMFDEPEKCNIMYGMYVRKTWRGGKASVELAREGARIELAKGFVTGVTVIKAGNEKPMKLAKQLNAKLIDQRFSFDIKSAAQLGESDG